MCSFATAPSCGPWPQVPGVPLEAPVSPDGTGMTPAIEASEPVEAHGREDVSRSEEPGAMQGEHTNRTVASIDMAMGRLNVVAGVDIPSEKPSLAGDASASVSPDEMRSVDSVPVDEAGPTGEQDEDEGEIDHAGVITASKGNPGAATSPLASVVAGVAEGTVAHESQPSGGIGTQGVGSQLSAPERHSEGGVMSSEAVDDVAVDVSMSSPVAGPVPTGNVAQDMSDPPSAPAPATVPETPKGVDAARPEHASAAPPTGLRAVIPDVLVVQQPQPTSVLEVPQPALEAEQEGAVAAEEYQDLAPDVTMSSPAAAAMPTMDVVPDIATSAPAATAEAGAEVAADTTGPVLLAGRKRQASEVESGDDMSNPVGAEDKGKGRARVSSTPPPAKKRKQTPVSPTQRPHPEENSVPSESNDYLRGAVSDDP